uniref:Peptidase A2 domain-containing protein n=1 Tax=Gongylonema pulchrum TaxID=637853 RepID=A0A183EE73_9BILA
LQIRGGDIILVTTNQQATSTGRRRNPNDLIADLVKSIKVPKASSSRHGNSGLHEDELAQLRAMFDGLRNNPERLNSLRGVIPDLVTAVEQNNFDMFIAKYVADREQAIARQRAMLDPSSAEGQRLIAEQIERENIDYSHQFALEHMPEAYIPVTMLYIRMKINGIAVKAFIDSGAQVSILSERIAQRCNLMRLVDKRFRRSVHGVGGMQTLIGKIHACKRIFVKYL